MRRKKQFFIILLTICFQWNVGAQTLSADNTVAATEQLKTLRNSLLQDLQTGKSTRTVVIRKMLDVGLWNEALNALMSARNEGVEYAVLFAHYFILNNDFKSAENEIKTVLAQYPDHEEAILAKAFLEIQAWRLPEAATICEKALLKKPSAKIEIMLGRAKLLQKDYSGALKIAQKLIAKNPKDAAAYLLEADVYFWNQQPEKAETPLKKSLEIDPFNADARFSYGYAIWRRIDATQLNAMAAQWELALAINPLHFQTHWHWGNGHTNLTYADYAQKEDDEVRNALKKADDLIWKNKVDEAIAVTREIETQYPQSVLPLLTRGSIYYMAYDMDRKVRLDSAEKIFRTILERKKHFGPAHNGLSAVIKSQRIPYLANYDSITHALNTTKITDMANFEKVFSDVAYYPGDMAKAMVWNQMYASVVYFPFLSKQNRNFHVPPLHIDLATSMNSSFFRFGTTFDNRQWMDIRGVGSGAAAIEYVERGAYLERNVVLHEYVHLFHSTVLTDDENREIRKHYYTAMKEKRTLDYYSQNNESEYFAQTYPAYFEPVKVHPLDFKSMNTTTDLKSKDPGMYAFLDKMVKRQEAYLAGDKQAMASNWAQVYLNLSNGKRGDTKSAALLIDTALTYDDKYLPAYIAYANLKKEEKKFSEAVQWLQKAQKINKDYAPVYVAYAGLTQARADAGLLDGKTAVKEQTDYLKKASQLETDYQELARVGILLREHFRNNSMRAEAISAAENYAKNGANISTYLRDRVDDAVAFGEGVKAALGYEESAKVLGNLVAQKPQNFEYRNFYADALAANKEYDKAIATLKEAQRILAASGNSRADYDLRIAQYYHESGKKDSLQNYLNAFLDGKKRVGAADSLRLIRLLSASGNTNKAASLFQNISQGKNSFTSSDYYFTHGVLMNALGNKKESISSLEKSISLNAYNLNAYLQLKNVLNELGDKMKIAKLKAQLQALTYKPAKRIIDQF